MKVLNVEQGSEQWLQARAGKITASRSKDARDFLKTGKPSSKQTAYAAQVAVERLAQRPIDQGFQNWQMREGQVQEPEARLAYEANTGNLVQEVGAIETEDGLFLYSPDGIVGDDGLLEIKSLFSAERICQIIGDGDVSDFIDQCNFGLWLTGRQWIDLCIWAPSLAPIGLELTIHHITRDEAAIEALEADLMAFSKLVAEFENKLRSKAKTNLDLQKIAA